MENITFAPAYVAFYPHIAEIARDHGYSLAIHGSCGKNRRSDLDLVAVPWIEDAKSAEDLINAISDYAGRIINRCYFDRLNPPTELLVPSERPHNRRSWKIQIGNGAALDISIMKRSCDA